MRRSDADAEWMRVALGLARRSLGQCWPNPAVGCVLVAGGRVVGRGWTQAGGRPHAEAMALAQAGAAARGATAYVTLEPCDHTGKTPPCSLALIDAGVARVVMALRDPDPRVNGRGEARLRAAGMEVVGGVLEREAADLNAGFLSRVTRGRPLLTLKLATSLDGRIATASGESRWITGPAARAEVHLARAQSDAILIGGGTARSDDPGLDVRDLGLGDARPVRIVVSATLDLPMDAKLARTAREQPLWLCHRPNLSPERKVPWEALGAELIEVPVGRDGLIDLGAMAGALGERGLTRVFCEGGGQLAAGLLSAQLVDELTVYSAGLSLGAEGIPAIGSLGLGALSDAPRFILARSHVSGRDLAAVWRTKEN